MCRGQQRAPHTRGHGKRRSIFTTVPAVSTRGVAISACLAIRAYSDATHRILSPLLPVYRPPLPHTLVSDCTVPCSYMVHPGYAYPSALLWVDLPIPFLLKLVLLSKLLGTPVHAVVPHLTPFLLTSYI